MIEEVKVCVDAKKNFLNEYFDIPESLSADVNSLMNDIASLGETCTSANEFEEKFISTELSSRFNSLIQICPSKRVKMTKEDRANVAKTTKQILSDNKEELINDAITKMASDASNKMNEEAITARREAMIDADVYDDYTRANNQLDIVNSIVGLFKKKKEK